MNTSTQHEAISSMFDGIARQYDALNHILSLGLDYRWRRAAIRQMVAIRPQSVLDLAAGTGDMSLTLLKRYKPTRLCCADLSPEMLARGKRKLARRHYDSFTQFVECSAEALPFPEAEFQAVMIGFGVRNFADIPQAMREVARVLTEHGRLVVLEFSMPKRGIFALLYRFYLRILLPLLGGLISGSFKAYRYLPSSMERYARESPLPAAIKAAGLHTIATVPLSGGAVLLTVAEKR